MDAIRLRIFILIFTLFTVACQAPPQGDELFGDQPSESTPNSPPSLSLSCSNALDQDVNFACTANGTDPDGTASLGYQLGTGNTCAWASVSSTGQITGTPTDDDVGSCDLSITVKDFFLEEATDVVSIAISNLAPTLSISDAATIGKNSPATVIRTDGDVDANEESFGVYSFDHTNTSVPKCNDNGTLSIDTSTGEVTYTPATGFQGNCNVRVVFDDENGETNSTVEDEFAITVSSNTAPSISGSCSTSVTQDVAYTTCSPSVTDPDPDTHTWSMAAGNTCGWLSINSSNGQITGTPDDDDVGSCSLQFKTNDGLSDSNTLAFSISVTNVAPTLTIADPAAINQDSPATVIRADGDVAASEEGFGVYSLDNATTTAPKCSDNGTLSIDTSNGAVTYTPANAFSGTCNVKVQFDDENGLGSSTVNDEFLVTVTDVNDPPVISASCSTTATQDIAYTTCSPTVSDPDTGDSHTWSTETGHDCSWMAINSSNGQITGTPDDDDVGSCTLKFKANDGTVDSNILTFTVNIANVAPTLTIADAADISKNASATEIRADGDVAASEEGFGVYSFDHATTTAPKCDDNGTLSINTTNGAVTYTPATNYFGTCNIKVLFDDENGLGSSTVTDEFQITVLNNTIPSISASCSTTATQDAAYTTCNPSVTDPDPDTHTWSKATGDTCAWLAINSSNGQITGTPDDDDVGSCTLKFKTNDGTDDSNELTFTVNIANVAPTLTIVDATAINEDPGATVIRTDGDVAANEEGFGVYSIDDASTTAPKCADNGTVSINSTNGAVTYTPALDYNGACNITVKFDDQNGLGSSTVTDEFAITVNAVDDSPTVSDIANKQTAMDTTLKFIFFTADEGGGADEDSQILSVTSITSSNQTIVPNANITNTFNDNGAASGANGEIEITPAASQTGTVTITVTVSDGNTTGQDTFDLTIFNPTDPPVAFNVSATTTQNNATAVTLSADPAPGENIASWNIVTNPQNGTLSGTAPNLTYTPNTGFSGTDEFTYTVTDDDEGEVSNVAVATIIVDGSALFVVGNTTLPQGDAKVRDRIIALGFTVTIVDDNNCTSATNCDGNDANDFDMVILSSSISSSQITNKFTNTAVPLFTWERFLYDDLNMTASSGGSDAGTVSATQIDIVDDTHPLAGSLSNGTYTVFNSAFNLVWGVPTGSATVVAETAAGDPVMFVYEKDDSMYNSATAPAKRVGYFLPDSGLGDLSADGETLLDAAIDETLSR